MMMAMPQRMMAGVWIDELGFPDENFRSYVSSKIDQNQNGYLDDYEIEKVYSITVNNMNIGSLAGISCFTNLKELRCWGNHLRELNLGNLGKLEVLRCSKKQFDFS